MEIVVRNVSQDESALEELLALGMRSTPVIVIGEEVVVGFDRGRIERLLEAVKTP